MIEVLRGGYTARISIFFGRSASSRCSSISTLLMLANGTPVIAKKLFGDHYSYPLDGDLIFPDGRPVLGRSKTIRGIVLAVLVTTAAAPLIGLGWRIGFLVGGFAMIGDLLSSFCKRRLGLPSSSRARGLDQIPEAHTGPIADR
jgi:hypothetical protein